MPKKVALLLGFADLWTSNGHVGFAGAFEHHLGLVVSRSAPHFAGSGGKSRL